MNWNPESISWCCQHLLTLLKGSGQKPCWCKPQRNMVPLGWRSHPQSEGAHPGSSATQKAEPLDSARTSGPSTATQSRGCSHHGVFTYLNVLYDPGNQWGSGRIPVRLPPLLTFTLKNTTLTLKCTCLLVHGHSTSNRVVFELLRSKVFIFHSPWICLQKLWGGVSCAVSPPLSPSPRHTPAAELDQWPGWAGTWRWPMGHCEACRKGSAEWSFRWSLGSDKRTHRSREGMEDALLPNNAALACFKKLTWGHLVI